jgi:VanZ family protein
LAAVTRDLLLLVGWSLVVAVLLLAPGDLESDAPDWLSELADAGADKLVHAALFFVQACCVSRVWVSRVRVSRAWRGRAAGGVWLAAGLAAAYGLALELMQWQVPGRGWEAADVAANTIGAFLWPLASRALKRRA